MSGGEQHRAVDAVSFARARTRGDFGLAWHAYGVSYAIPSEAMTALDDARVVVANVSRSVISRARQRYAPVKVLNVTADANTVRRRLQRRGRDSAPDVAARLERFAVPIASDADVAEIVNDGSLDDGVDAFVDALHALVP